MIELCVLLMGNVSNFMQKQTFFSCGVSTNFRVWKAEEDGNAHATATNSVFLIWSQNGEGRTVVIVTAYSSALIFKAASFYPVV